MIDKVFDFQMLRDPMLAIFGSKLDMVLERKKYYLLQILFNAAKKAITLRLLQKEPPTVTDD